MKKVFRLQDLDCTNCAAKMERGIAKIKGVSFVNVSFISQKLTLEAQDDIFEDVVKEAVKVCKKIEPDCKIIL